MILDELRTLRALSEDAAALLSSRGFVVVPDIVSSERIEKLCLAYDEAERTATEPDKRIGSTSTRVSDFVNRGAEFADIYLNPSILEACCRVIGGPFKLSSFQSRTVRPRVRAQDLHVDVKHGSADWPLLGFILMVDEFRRDNGATRFMLDSGQEVPACGSRGSLLIYNGSTLHGHGANETDQTRRSLQGAFIPRMGKGSDFAARMSIDTRARLSPTARWLLSLD